MSESQHSNSMTLAPLVTTSPLPGALPSPSYSPSSSSSFSAPAFADEVDVAVVSSLAASVRRRNTGESCPCTTQPDYQVGTYSVIWFVDFEDGEKWSLRMPIAQWSPTLERRLRSDLFVVQLIQSRTTIPLPAIHDSSVTGDNVFSRPYTLCSRPEGTELGKLWFNREWFNDDTRRNVFTSLAKQMLQLKVLEFPAIGSLHANSMADNVAAVGPLLPSWDALTFNAAGVEQDVSGPSYFSTKSYLLGEIDRQTKKTFSDAERDALASLRSFAEYFPEQTFDGPPFVLGPPALTYDNVFVDDVGDITSIAYWDASYSLPRQLGYASYPLWITRDWDPSSYGYHLPIDANTLSMGISAAHLREQQLEDSPEVLQQFRDEYLGIIDELDPPSANLTRHSHVMHALATAVFTSFLRGNLVEKLGEHVRLTGKRE